MRLKEIGSAFFPKSSKKEPKTPPGWIILDIWVLLSFISAEILLANTFLFLVVCIVVKNNSFCNSSSWKIFSFILNIVPVLFFAADFKLLHCAVVSLALASW